jgi:hypothetical protein
VHYRFLVLLGKTGESGPVPTKNPQSVTFPSRSRIIEGIATNALLIDVDSAIVREPKCTNKKADTAVVVCQG